MTYKLAHAAAWDAGNRSMRAAGRKTWSADDYAACCAEFNRLMTQISQCEATYRGDIEVDQRPGDYFVSAVDGDQFALASGPYPNHAAALADLEAVKRQAIDLNPGGWFYQWGTCRLETGSGKLGALQKRGMREIS